MNVHVNSSQTVGDCKTQTPVTRRLHLPTAVICHSPGLFHVLTRTAQPGHLGGLGTVCTGRFELYDPDCSWAYTSAKPLRQVLFVVAAGWQCQYSSGWTHIHSLTDVHFSRVLARSHMLETTHTREDLNIKGNVQFNILSAYEMTGYEK